MRWQIEGTDEFIAWFLDLTETDQIRVEEAVNLLEEHGPALRRPYVGKIEGSRHSKMCELIPPASNIRVFFVWDPRQSAILLIGGDKTNDWTGFYTRMIPMADALYDTYLEEIRQEGQIP